MSKQETLEATLAKLAKERGSHKAIMKEVRKLYPRASKKQIIRAAFAQMIERAEEDLDSSRPLQDFAIAERSSADK
ncbi:hypothetical protein FF80_01929 [Devosia sp. LC5]|uniref:hypothetical protein n=1 Tax=Devosia sp. LC5 TaxID=1502724 RepID=UPI0004E3070F|nr:hypothetical protein [Devosia sp. LC5]KFC68205.1 hypothetical protein FF80_01929 [Devosia sp. LC5]